MNRIGGCWAIGRSSPDRSWVTSAVYRPFLASNPLVFLVVIVLGPTIEWAFVNCLWCPSGRHMCCLVHGPSSKLFDLETSNISWLRAGLSLLLLYVRGLVIESAQHRDKLNQITGCWAIVESSPTWSWAILAVCRSAITSNCLVFLELRVLRPMLWMSISWRKSVH